MTDFERNCYGTFEAQIDLEVKNMEEKWMQSPAATAFSILSDVQELISMGCEETARKKINVVKYIIGKHWMEIR